MADLTTMSTAFPTNYASTALVNANTPFTGCYGTVTVASNALTVLCGTSYGNGANTAQNYTWNGTGFYFQVTPAPKGGAATAMETFCAIVDGSSTDQSIRIAWNFNLAPATPTLTAIHYNTDNTYTDPEGAVQLNYNATDHAWIGWYYDTSNQYWVTSPDGNTWTTRRTASRQTWLTTQTDIGYVFTTNRVSGSNTNATSDNYNTGGTAPGAVTARGTQPNQGYPSNNVLASFW